MYTTVRKRKAIQGNGKQRGDGWVDDPHESQLTLYTRASPIPSDFGGLERGSAQIKLKNPANNSCYYFFDAGARSLTRSLRAYRRRVNAVRA
jgi:hypothetical protein